MMNEQARIVLPAQSPPRWIGTTAPDFAEEFRLQARLVRDAEDKNDDVAFVEVATDIESWDA